MKNHTPNKVDKLGEIKIIRAEINEIETTTTTTKPQKANRKDQ